MIVVIDNYDSFTYNLVQYFGELLLERGQNPDKELKVFRNDETSVDQVAALKPERLVISPGPCTPAEAGISVAAIQKFAGRVPILGVCLGHQSIGAAFGGKIVRAPTIMHGKTSLISHDQKGVFKDIETPFEATRYHSLIVEKASLPAELVVSATTDDGVIMGFRHRKYKIEGVQFHPESILTPVGKTLLNNFLNL